MLAKLLNQSDISDQNTEHYRLNSRSRIPLSSLSEPVLELLPSLSLSLRSLELLSLSLFSCRSLFRRPLCLMSLKCFSWSGLGLARVGHARSACPGISLSPPLGLTRAGRAQRRVNLVFISFYIYRLYSLIFCSSSARRGLPAWADIMRFCFAAISWSPCEIAEFPKLSSRPRRRSSAIVDGTAPRR